jgi:hypothetical protein
MNYPLLLHYTAYIQYTSLLLLHTVIVLLFLNFSLRLRPCITLCLRMFPVLIDATEPAIARK